MNKIIPIFTLAALLAGLYILILYFNDNCMEPQVIEAHIYNCDLLNSKESCSWLKENNILKGYKLDKTKVQEACLSSSNLANHLVKVASKGKVGE
jgi:hypothetical protein